MKAVPVREFIRPKALKGGILSADRLFDELKTNHTVLFDDGILELSSKELIINRYVWTIFEVCDKIPICKRHSINQYYTNGFYTSNSLSSLLETIFRDVVDIYVRPNEDRSILNDYFYEAIGDIYNKIYNNVVCRSLEYCNSIDIEDFLEIQVKPRLLEAIKNVIAENSEESIRECYKVLDDILRNDPSIAHNSVRKGYISGTFNAKQVLTILGSVGHAADLDASIFKVPISRSYTLGMQSAYEQAIASRLASKSLYTSTTVIKDSEYLARKIQLVTMRVDELVDGDCGSTEYLEVKIDFENDKPKSDLVHYAGKRYVCPETGELKVIKPTDTHLKYENLGKPILVRSPLKCRHKHNNSVCTVCLGDISYSVPYYSNLGHTLSAALTAMISQMSLSDKHHQDSAIGIDYQLDPSVKFFRKNKHALYFKTSDFNTAKCQYHLVVPHDSMKGLSGLASVEDLRNVISQKVSCLEQIYICITNKNTGSSELLPLYIAFSKRGINDKKKVAKKSFNSKIHGHFSLEFLKYILNDRSKCVLRTSGMSSDDIDFYYIDINAWIEGETRKEHVIEYPIMQDSLSQVVDEFQASISKVDKGIKPEEFLENIYYILGPKFNVNIAILEVMALAFSIKSTEKFDVHIDRSNDAEIQCIKFILQHGSNGGFYGFENHSRFMFDPKGFNFHNNVNHILDGLLCPKEVMDEIKEGKRR